MPWLVRNGSACGNKPLLFVHVPRCGGTSLNQQFRVMHQARAGRDVYHRAGMRYFAYRYQLLERANFPLAPYETLLACAQIVLGYLIWVFGWSESLVAGCVPEQSGGMALPNCAPGAPSVAMWTLSALGLICSTFLFTAPVSGRVGWMRRAYLAIVGRVMCNFTAAYDQLTGVGDKGYIVHWTAAKMVKYGHLSEEGFAQVENFTIVRNPFSRMVSLYMYNRFGQLESFEHFVEAWHTKWLRYKALGSTEERDVYCHVLPQHEYTHMAGRQLVMTVIKQEDLKEIVSAGGGPCFSAASARDVESGAAARALHGSVPQRIVQVLQSMPHTNRRQREKPWQDYYNARTLQLVIEMYRADFELFGYPVTVPGRPDLDEPALTASVLTGAPPPPREPLGAGPPPMPSCVSVLPELHEHERKPAAQVLEDPAELV
jgi:hypothetical protein